MLVKRLDGGVFYTGRAGSQVNVTSSYFEFNSARNRGGVAVALGSHVFINGTSLINNSAYWGGVLRACNSEVVTPDIDLFVGTDPTNSQCDLYYESNTTIPEEDTREYATTTEPITSSSSNGLTTAAGTVASSSSNTFGTAGPSSSDSHSNTIVTDHIVQTTRPVTETINTDGKLEGEGVWRSLTILCLCVSFIVLILVAVLYVGVAVYIARRKVNHCHNGCCSCESKGGKGDTGQMTNLLTDKETTP